MSVPLRLALATGIATLLAILSLDPALAQAQQGTPTNLQFVGASATRTKGEYVLTARLTTTAGKPLDSVSVEFYQQVDTFGSQQSYLGTASTDSTGTASLVYHPAAAGRQAIKVSVSGKGYAPAQASGSADFRDAVPPFSLEPLPLAPVGQWLLYGIVVLLLAIWALLLGVLLTTIRGIRGATTPPGPLRAPASPVAAPRSTGSAQ